ncbi:hypothetical protein [Pseudoalteromonas rubra]|uniref:hypothetical protein n=1 Tax=Pseudoalteromonas rubra TaxID=43658 RepID=UPI001981517F|nr:hypothetical protein [Pseudoalteromonas rubra]
MYYIGFFSAFSNDQVILPPAILNIMITELILFSLNRLSTCLFSFIIAKKQQVNLKQTKKQYMLNEEMTTIVFRLLLKTRCRASNFRHKQRFEVQRAQRELALQEQSLQTLASCSAEQVEECSILHKLKARE